MDITPKQFNAVTSELRKIREHLDTLRNDFNQRCEAVYAAYERHEQKRHQLPAPFEIKLEENQEGKREAESRHQQGIQNSIRKATWFTFVATTLAFCAAAIYAYVAHQQLGEMALAREQAERVVILNTGQLTVANRTSLIAQKSIYLEERAWLSAHGASTYNPPNNQIEVGKPFFVRVGFQNTGKSPAINIVAVQLMTIVRTDGKVPELAPKIDFSNSVKYPATTFGTVMPYAGVGNAFSDAVITLNLQQGDYDAIKTNKLHVFTHGKITYCDIFGREHWATWCYHLLSGGAYAVCKNSNDIDREEDVTSCPVTKPLPTK